MKTINKYVAFFTFIFLSFTCNASNLQVNKEDLISRMAENKNVELLVAHSTKMLCLKYALTSETTDQDKKILSNQQQILIDLSNETMKSIFADFPEFANLNSNDRKEIFSAVMNTPIIYVKSKAAFKCIGKAIGGFAACSFGSLGSIQLWVFGGCIAAAMGADLLEIATAVVIGNGAGLAASLAAIEFQTPIEAQGCWELASASRAKYTKAVVQNCLTSAWTYIVVECM